MHALSFCHRRRHRLHTVRSGSGFLQIDLGLSMSLAFRLPISCTDSTRSLSRSRLRVLLCSCEFRASWATAVVGGAWRELYCEENKSLNEFCVVVPFVPILHHVAVSASSVSTFKQQEGCKTRPHAPATPDPHCGNRASVKQASPSAVNSKMQAHSTARFPNLNGRFPKPS